MLDLIGSWLVSIWPHTPELKALDNSSLLNWVQTTDPKTLTQPQLALDAGAIAAVDEHLTALEKTGLPTNRQGIWAQSGRKVLANHLGTQPLPAASLTKIATTLVALETWGADHQFTTIVGYIGTIENGLLQGDLIIQGGDDPFFVWEEAIALGNAINQAGIQAITGDLVIVGSFAMNYKANPLTAGQLLRQAMHRDLWSAETQTQFETLPPGTPQPQLSLQGSVRVVEGDRFDASTVTPLIQHRSIPLIEMLKLMNIYSNNFIADALADSLGGGETLAQRSAAMIQVPPQEIQLINGSGLGAENQISARAVCALLIKTQAILKEEGWAVSDVLPVAGIDGGTIEGRPLPPATAVKTGTLSVVSTLAGAMPTEEQEVVWFAILNWGSDLDGLRDQQDQLLKNWGHLWIATSQPIQPSQAEATISHSDGRDSRGHVNFDIEAIARRSQSGDRLSQLGDPSRNILLQPTSSSTEVE